MVYKLYAAIALSLLLGIAIAVGGNHYMNLREAAASNEARGQKIKATAGIIKDGDAADTDRAQTDVSVLEARANYERERQNDATLVDRDSKPVPERLRQLDRERRLARERLASLEQRANSPPGTKDATDR